MFLDKFNEYQNKCKELSIVNAKNCKICNGLGTIPNPNGTHNRCKCQTNAMIIARQICNGEPERFLKLDWKDLSKIDINEINKVKNYVTNLDDNYFNVNNLFFYSRSKMNIALVESVFMNKISFMRNYDKCFYNCVMISVDDILQTNYTIRNNIDMKKKFNKIFEISDVLMINYLGSEMDSRSEITSRLISNIITNRTFNNKLTFLSSTLRTGEIGSKYGEEFLEILKNDYKIISLNNVISNGNGVDDTNGYY